MLEKGKEILSQQSFSLLLGTKLDVFEAGTAELSLDMRDDLKQNNGFAHGGVVSYLADNCITFAGASVLGSCVTSEYKVNYVRPAIGDRLIARSTVLYSGKRQATCECKVYAKTDNEEKLVAVSLGTINKIDASQPS
ncbi:PaaI family thioesterase [Photobacterium sp. WH77]|uniref:PaaI family thioesterase n=1 Tax=unclassified Photobacterium TaxID=2628852 RepID=UPI001EDA16FF|nr:MULTISPECIES: PaaI family thioesterase [unclassified Photobacterium]MCG2837886.1 PaaI family thioesterase [Photobacterium sp. WH77]MCG2845504.1 PaaI family thioesterase [Photobacterium sp. WH80]